MPSKFVHYRDNVEFYLKVKHQFNYSKARQYVQVYIEIIREGFKNNQTARFTARILAKKGDLDGNPTNTSAN